MPSMESALASVSDLVGEAHVRAATPADAAAGVVPMLVAEPGGEAEMAALLRLASRTGLAVVPRGTGSSLDWGEPPRRCDLLVSTARLRGVLDHAAADMVAVIRAGTPLGEIQSVLGAAPHRQRVALDPPLAGSLGGILATNRAGGLRQLHGTPRDLLLGARFVLADGTMASSGGRVVKNVAGYDVGRLLCGSLGTLAVLVEATVKLHPLPAARHDVVLEGARADRLGAAVEALRTSAARPAAIDVHWPDGLLRVRCEGTEAGAGAAARLVAEAVGGRIVSSPERLEELDASLHGRPWGGEGLIAGVGIPRTALAALLGACSEVAAEVVVRAGVGAAEARLPADAAALIGLRAAVEGLGGHLSLRRGGSLLPGLVWPDGDEAAAGLTRALKAELDPTGTLSPGRQQGGV